MKKFLLFALLGSVFFVSCTKDESVPNQQPSLPTEQKESYEFESIRFFLLPGNERPDTLSRQLDTIHLVNNSNLRQPDAELRPYELIKDSFGLKFENGFPAVLNNAIYRDSILLPHEIMMGQLYYSGDRKIVAGHIPVVVVPASRISGTGLKLSVMPKTRYAVTGTYHYIVSHAGFEAIFREKVSQKAIVVKGRWFSSVATTQSFNGSAALITSADSI